MPGSRDGFGAAWRPDGLRRVDPGTLVRVVSCIPAAVELSFAALDGVAGETAAFPAGAREGLAAPRDILRRCVLLGLDTLVGLVSRECSVKIRLAGEADRGGARIVLDGSGGCFSDGGDG